MDSLLSAVTSFMKKRGMWVACCAVVSLAAILGILNLTGGAAARTEISIQADYYRQGDRHTVEVSQRIGYVNSSGVALDEVCLHLYPLAYEEKAGAESGSAGLTRIESVRVGGKEASFSVEGTSVRIPMAAQLKQGQSADIELHYALDIPDSRMRYGAGEYSLNLLNAFAIPAVYDGLAWRTDGYNAVGDPFYSEVADYKVELSAPEGTTIAGTGTAKGAKHGSGRVTYVFDAPMVRDFAAVLMQECAVAQAEAGDVRVISYAPNQEGADRALEYATRAIEAMTLLFGSCEYPEVEVCAADLFSGGMEYPGVAVISADLYQQGNEAALEYCVAHEVAHQWWYGAVGSDQIRAPWLDESLAEYSTLLYFEQVYGANGFQSAYRRFVRPHLMRRGLAAEPIEQPITAFGDNDEYTAVVYAKGAAMWHALRQEMGDEAFFAALKRYYDENAQSIATKQDLYNALGGDWAAFVEEWLTGRAP